MLWGCFILDLSTMSEPINYCFKNLNSKLSGIYSLIRRQLFTFLISNAKNYLYSCYLNLKYLLIFFVFRIIYFCLSTFISRVGKKKKSSSRARLMVMAESSPIWAFMLNPEKLKMKKPVTRASVVTHMAVPTVLKA